MTNGTTTRTVPVVLAGAYGHGWWHLENLRRLTDGGLVRLAGVCDVREIEPGLLRGLGRPERSADLGELIERTGAEVTILVTPIHTHRDLAIRALEAGSHVLLEKPPAATLAGFREVEAVVQRHGPGLSGGVPEPRLGGDSRDPPPGRRGRHRPGARHRRRRRLGAPSAYFTRSAWAGKRRAGRVDVMDGALTNPFAHAVATALAVAGKGLADDVAGIDAELFHANPIEADDTSCLRIRSQLTGRRSRSR